MRDRRETLKAIMTVSTAAGSSSAMVREVLMAAAANEPVQAPIKYARSGEGYEFDPLPTYLQTSVSCRLIFTKLGCFYHIN